MSLWAGRCRKKGETNDKNEEIDLTNVGTHHNLIKSLIKSLIFFFSQQFSVQIKRILLENGTGSESTTTDREETAPLRTVSVQRVQSLH